MPLIEQLFFVFCDLPIGGGVGPRSDTFDFASAGDERVDSPLWNVRKLFANGGQPSQSEGCDDFDNLGYSRLCCS